MCNTKWWASCIRSFCSAIMIPRQSWNPLMWDGHKGLAWFWVALENKGGTAKFELLTLRLICTACAPRRTVVFMCFTSNGRTKYGMESACDCCQFMWLFLSMHDWCMGCCMTSFSWDKKRHPHQTIVSAFVGGSCSSLWGGALVKIELSFKWGLLGMFSSSLNSMATPKLTKSMRAHDATGWVDTHL